MAQNKRYKRLAKRVVGTCHNNEICAFEGCKYCNICEHLVWDLGLSTPMYAHIKDVRNGLKGGKYSG